MLKILGIAILVLAVAAGGVAVYAMTKPDTFRVQRTISIKAPPEKIFPFINEFQNWKAWSPYERKDPSMKRTLSGSASGQGAIYEWDGDKNVGKGRMEITESTPPNKVAIDLHFMKPFEGRNIAEFTMTPQGDATTVTWAMHGPALFITKLISTFINMDKMIGDDFDAGLVNLKALAEK